MLDSMNRENGKNSLTSKRHNRGLVLQLIASGTCRTRIELSRRTGLNKSTLTNIVSEFLERGIVREAEAVSTEACGRNPICLEISEQAPKIIGLLVFRDRAEAVLCDLTMKVIREASLTFDRLTEEELLQDCFRLIDRVRAGEQRVLGIGVASIGPLNIRKGVILNPPEFFGIRNVNIRSILEEHYQLPVILEHDNNCAALAEKMYGSGRDAEDFIFLGVSNGIGSGLICGGEIYHNRRGLGSEMGHVSIQRDGLPCPCGNRGCLWMYASTPVILRQLRDATGKDLSYGEFCRCSDNPAVSAVLSGMLENISAALVSVINVFQPEKIILGHDCMDWTEDQLLWLEDRINERKIAADGYRIPVEKAMFGRKALVIGAACIVAHRAFEGELLP